MAHKLTHISERVQRREQLGFSVVAAVCATNLDGPQRAFTQYTTLR